MQLPRDLCSVAIPVVPAALDPPICAPGRVLNVICWGCQRRTATGNLRLPGILLSDPSEMKITVYHKVEGGELASTSGIIRIREQAGSRPRAEAKYAWLNRERAFQGRTKHVL